MYIINNKLIISVNILATWR